MTEAQLHKLVEQAGLNLFDTRSLTGPDDIHARTRAILCVNPHIAARQDYLSGKVFDIQGFDTQDAAYAAFMGMQAE